jgi:hypothetical protein
LYRAPGIVDVTPSGARINTGNSEVIITVVLESVQGNDDIQVTLAGNLCTPVAVTTMEVDGVKLTNIQVRAPQFSRDMAGMLDLKVSSNSSSWEFTRDWEYLEPPTPAIVADSIRINDEWRDPLWVEKNLAAPVEAEVVISNLSPKFDMEFDQLEVWFDGVLQAAAPFTTEGTSARVFFSLNTDGLQEDVYNMTIHVKLKGVVKFVLVCRATFSPDVSDLVCWQLSSIANKACPPPLPFDKE